MLRQLIIISSKVILVSNMLIVDPGPLYKPTKGEVWPKPQYQEKQNTYYKLNPSVFQFTVNGESCQILRAAINRYYDVITGLLHICWRHMRKHSILPEDNDIKDRNYKGDVTEVKIKISSPCQRYPQMGMDEAYNLNISTVSILNSDTIWGALRGMETFVQLLYLSDDYKSVFINGTYIDDYPRYPHRGVLIDTARHYISISNILKTLDAMEMNKLNVLHWHIVDDESFPYVSSKFPELSALGAYEQSMIYTKENISYIVDYARDRGIRILPELDVPGHTRSWGIAYPDLLTKCYQAGKEVGLGPMDPTDITSFIFITELIREFQERFPEKYFHIGGDEVELSCWKSNPSLKKFMKAHKMKHVKDLHAYFIKTTIRLLGARSKPIVWEEVFTDGVKLGNGAVQVWKTNDYELLLRILKAGYKIIYSTDWYLTHIRTGGSDWIEFYKIDPRRLIPTSYKNVNLDNIIGGEACMWGEVVDDTNIQSRVWPRASAVAEKLWSPELSHDGQLYYSPLEVYHRIEEHSCRMNRRGIHSQPPNGPGFCIR